jgi:DNA-binding response OmpR family regulator
MAKILFIDDDLQTLALMDKQARILGHQPILCPNSADAVQFAVICSPDLVLIDINMQEFSGYDIVKQIRAYRQISGIPILVISAGEPEIEGIKSIEVGANGFISKPLTIKRLDEAVKTYTNHTQET